MNFQNNMKSKIEITHKNQNVKLAFDIIERKHFESDFKLEKVLFFFLFYCF